VFVIELLIAKINVKGVGFMKGSDRIATLVLIAAVAGVVVLKCIMLELSWETIGLLVVAVTIAIAIYFRGRSKRRMN